MNRKPIICIDAGHGGNDSGALGPGGLRESDVALRVALLTGAALAGCCDIVYTRRSDEFIELARRATISNDAQADAFLSIHCNSGPPGQGDGFEVFTTHGETASDRLAVDVFSTWAQAFPHKRKRMDLSDADEDKEAGFTVLTRTHARAILFEMEFIHTSAGEAWLKNPDNQSRAADALALGVMKHFSVGAYGAGAAIQADAAGVTGRESIRGLIRAKALEIRDLIDSLT